MSIQNPMSMLPALLIAIAAMAAALARGIDMPKRSFLLIGLGMLLLALAAGRPILHLATPQVVTVLVDVSPSTRGADFRDFNLLRKRLDELMKGTTYKTVSFANGIATEDQGLREIAVDHTTLQLPPDAAVVLFSDGRFELPSTGPPTYPVIDAKLQNPPDGAVGDLELRGNLVIAHVRNDGRDRVLNWSGTSDRGASRLPRGRSILQSRAIHAPLVSATLSGGDLWPENDVLSLRVPSTQRTRRLWISTTPPPPDWTAISPANLPTDPGAYLPVSAIVLDNVPADALSTVQQLRLQQYVRDLGGAVVLGGGDHAFAVGGWTGTVLDAISPLAGTPPQPSIHWILLGDSSGSMSQSIANASGSTRWTAAGDALVRVIPTLPPADLLSTGSFASEMRWWSWMRPAGESARQFKTPLDIHPQGPTNLVAALQSIAKATDGAMPVELLIISDADAMIDSIDSLAQLLADKRIRPHLLAIAPSGANNSVVALVNRLNGTIVSEKVPAQWESAARRLLQQVAPIRMNYAPASVRYDRIPLPPRRIEQWNTSWPKDGADVFARDEQTVLAARWNFGAGQVIVTAYQATSTELATMADVIAQPAQDPRFSVTWHEGSPLRMTIDAIDGRQPLNGLKPQLRLTGDSGDSSEPRTVPQTAPGRYEIELPANERAAFAIATVGSETISRRALAGRYPEEFDELGNDHDNLEELSNRTGGRVIEPTDHTPIQFDWPKRATPITSTTAIAGGAMIALGLIVWRRN